jgi:predicted MFS family arabinose efflux permease
VAWVRHERRVAARGDDPLVNLALFHVPAFSLGVALVVVMYIAAPCLFLLLAVYLQTGHGLSALESAAIFTPLALTFVGASFAGPRLIGRFGDRVLGAAAGTTAVTSVILGAVVLADRGGVPVAAVALVLLAMGVGQGIVMPGSVAAALRITPRQHAGAASGILSTAQQVGNVIGVALAGTVYFAVLSDGAGAGDHAVALAAAAGWTAVWAAAAAVLALAIARRARGAR